MLGFISPSFSVSSTACITSDFTSRSIWSSSHDSGSARGGGGRDGGIFGGDDIGRLWTDNGQRVWIVVRGGGERMPFAVIFPLLHRFSLYSGGMGTGIGVRCSPRKLLTAQC